MTVQNSTVLHALRNSQCQQSLVPVWLDTMPDRASIPSLTLAHAAPRSCVPHASRRGVPTDPGTKRWLASNQGPRVWVPTADSVPPSSWQTAQRLVGARGGVRACTGEHRFGPLRLAARRSPAASATCAAGAPALVLPTLVEGEGEGRCRRPMSSFLLPPCPPSLPTACLPHSPLPMPS